MNKAFENILERIDSYIEDAKSEGDFSYIKPFEIAKIAVQEVAEEYNGGWIPVSERLPENGGYYLVTYHEWSKGNFLPKYNDTYVRRMHYQKSERFTGWNYPRCVDDRAENDTNREVIAWQPLPEVYKN